MAFGSSMNTFYLVHPCSRYSEGASYRREESLAMGSLRGQGVVMSNYGLLLHDHVTLRCRSIDRIFLQAYVPRLQAVGEVCTFLRWQRKFPIPSSAAFGKIGEEYVKAVHRFAEANGIPVVYFKKGQNKEEVAGPYLQAAAKEGKERVVMIGIAQEKASVWRSWPRKGQEKARHPHMDWGREMAFINHFYFYLWDLEWGRRVLEDQRLCALSNMAVAQRS